MNDQLVEQFGQKMRVPDVEIEVLLTAYCLSDTNRLMAWLEQHPFAQREAMLTWLMSRIEQSARAKHLLQLAEQISDQAATDLLAACRANWEMTRAKAK